MKTLIIDNKDSFTYNLFHYVNQFTDHVDVLRDEQINILQIEEYDKIIFSPGPGLPKDHPVLKKVLDKFHANKSILGICLGHQAIAEYFNANLTNLKTVKHGVSSRVSHQENCNVFKGLPSNFNIGHYHSWVVNKCTLPNCLTITSENNEGIVTSFKHNEFDLKGLQFHPESILTEFGLKMIENWING